MVTFQELLRRLSAFWEEQGCVLWQGYDLEVGAGTFNPATFLRCIGPEPFSAAYVEPSRRPTDGRYGENPNRLQHFFQYQVILKPSPLDIQDLYLASLEALGFSLKDHDIRFVQDDWESPTLGAWGLGWEVWMDGMEITQFTYFQALAGMNLHPIPGEISYGIERLAMYLQGVDSIYDLQWNDRLRYGDIYHQSEVEWSHYNFEKATTEMWLRHFDDAEHEAKHLMEAGLPIPAYDFVMKASHAFNLLDARGVISVTERTGYIRRIRDLSRAIASTYLQSRKEKEFPLIQQLPSPLKEEKILTERPIPASLLTFSPGEKEDFLLEVGSEELPDSYIPQGMQSLEHLFRQFLNENALGFDGIQTYGTPRRIAIYVEGLVRGKPEEKKTRRGPTVQQAFDENGHALPSAIGFFRSFELEAPPLSAIRNGDFPRIALVLHKGEEAIQVEYTLPGVATAERLQKAIPAMIQQIAFPKKMRWGSSSLTYARPLQWIVALYGKEVVPVHLEYLLSDRYTETHRQMDPVRLPLSHAKDYLASLRKHYVLVDPKERKERIQEQLAAIEKEQKGHALARERVMESVVHMTEYPTLLLAHFDDRFLRIPKEVLIAEMVEHQRYFPLAYPKGDLQSSFVITTDTYPTEAIRRGNEKVLVARLADGVFLYEQDLQYPLEAMNEKLKHVTYQKELGSLYDKVERMMAHSQVLQRALDISSADKVERAARLSKADLATGMVYEFPALQGTMGRYYALASGENPEVAQAIEEQWFPRGEGEPLPETETGVILSLADKIDNLLSCYRIGLKPTSSADPYALRRQALGMIRILLRGNYRLPLHSILSTCFDHFATPPKGEKREILQELENFFLRRTKTVFEEGGIRKDELEASLSKGLSDVCDAFARVQALHVFRQESIEFSSLVEVYKRAKGQIAQGTPAPAFDAALCQENAEKKLFAKLSALEPQFMQSLQNHDYTAAYLQLASLQPPLALLFDEVKILDENPQLQGNRLALLERVFSLFGKLLNFAKIQ